MLKSKKVLVVTPAFGDRMENIKELSRNLKFYCPDWDWTIFTDNNIGYDQYCDQIYEVGYTDSSDRRFWRSGDYYKFHAFFTIGKAYKYIVVLDDDIRIVSHAINEGVILAERYHCCFPISPRQYFGVDLMVGADVSHAMQQEFVDVPSHLNILNIGIAFLLADSLLVFDTLKLFEYLMNKVPGRGTINMTAALWRQGFMPYVLPESWCLCADRVGTLYRKHQIIEPMALHCGHRDVKDFYERNFRDAELSSSSKNA